MAPTTPGSNPFTQIEDVVVTSFAELQTFQAWTSSANATEARENCFVGLFNSFLDTDDAKLKTPFVIIDAPEGAQQFEAFAYAKGPPPATLPPDGRIYQFQCDSTMTAEFRQLRNDKFYDDAEEEERLFKNAVGNIMNEFLNSAGLDGRYGVTRVFPDGPMSPYESRKNWVFHTWSWTLERLTEGGE